MLFLAGISLSLFDDDLKIQIMDNNLLIVYLNKYSYKGELHPYDRHACTQQINSGWERGGARAYRDVQSVREAGLKAKKC